MKLGRKAALVNLQMISRGGQKRGGDSMRTRPAQHVVDHLIALGMKTRIEIAIHRRAEGAAALDTACSTRRPHKKRDVRCGSARPPPK